MTTTVAHGCETLRWSAGTMVMDAGSARPIIEDMQRQAEVNLTEAEALLTQLIAAHEQCIQQIADLKLELAGFASMMGRSDERLIAEFRDKPGWERIPPAEIPSRLRQRQSEAERELYDARLTLKAALLKVRRHEIVVQELDDALGQFALLLGRPDDVLVAFLQRRGWQFRDSRHSA